MFAGTPFERSAPRTIAFGPSVLVPERQLLLQDDEQLRIGGRALDLLTALVERPGQLVDKRELMSRAWPHTLVDEGNLKVNLAALRRVLGDDAGTSQYRGRDNVASTSRNHEAQPA